MSDFDYLLTLPGEDRERRWLQERLETLSVRESVTLSAAVLRTAPEDMAQAINQLQSLDSYTVLPDAGSYEALGEMYLRSSAIPKDAFPYVDLTALGQRYEDAHPGLFVGSCYVAYPEKAPAQVYRQGGLLPDDSAWAVKLKLASPAVPEGVWLRLPGDTPWGDESTTEETLALGELRATRWDECTLLDARCILPYAGNLMEQYDSVADLIYDGSNLGYVLEERGQATHDFMAKYAAALELEGCRDLRLALDISQNLVCYDWAPRNGPEELAVTKLKGAGASEDLIRSGAIDLTGYGMELLNNMGYVQDSAGNGFIRRNGNEFDYQFSTPIPEQSGMTMQ